MSERSALAANPRLRGLVGATLGGLVAIAATLLIRPITGTALLAEIVVDASSDRLRPSGFSFFLDLFGAGAKPLLFLSVVLAQLLLFVVIWRPASQLLQRSLLRGILRATIAPTLVLLLASLAMIQFSEAKLGSRTGWPEYLAVTLLSCGLYALVAAGFMMATQQPADSAARSEADAFGRRRAVALLPVLGLGAVASYIIARALKGSTGGGVQVSTAGRETPELTSNQDFYIVSKNIVNPYVDRGDWRLRLGGAVTRMQVLTYDELLARPAVEQYTTLECISNLVGGSLISNALWKGVPLRDLIRESGPLGTARFVSFRSEDDYYESLSLEATMADGVILAYEMNGETLPDEHGFPLRLLLPDRYGMKQPKWITEIALMDHETYGYWGARGWDQAAFLKTGTRIDVPRFMAELDGQPMRISGIAFAGDKGISRVEVSVDGGRVWRDAQLKPALSRQTWALWYYDQAEPLLSGRLDILARATDGRGELQTEEENPPEPSGATGYPKTPVTIKRPV
jgi:DMSO/TMAO reductase YedYZ molybdopterin-dependent catalytic subunit